VECGQPFGLDVSVADGGKTVHNPAPVLSAPHHDQTSGAAPEGGHELPGALGSSLPRERTADVVAVPMDKSIQLEVVR
jgi:hypothetical protein